MLTASIFCVVTIFPQHTGLLNPAEYPALAAKRRKSRSRAEINAEAIRIRYGKTVKRVPRKRLALEVMNKAFNCDIFYLMDKTRAVFFPHEWKTGLLPWSAGVTYRIVVKSEGPQPEDPFDEYEYVADVGQSKQQLALSPSLLLARSHVERCGCVCKCQ